MLAVPPLPPVCQIKEEETPEQAWKGEGVIGKQLWELKGWEVEGGASKTRHRGLYL